MARKRIELLRQGRGAGFLAAIEAGRNASADLLDCVLNDPRWDRQVEAREDYYAQLMLATNTSLDAIRQFICKDDEEADCADLWLPIGVVAEMCRRGSDAAREAIVAGIDRGPWWRACLDALEAGGGVELIGTVINAKVVEALISRVGIDEIADAATAVAAPWEVWAEQVPALKFVVKSAARTPREARPMSGPVAWTASRIRLPEMPDDLSELPVKSLLRLSGRPLSQISGELARRTDPETVRLVADAATSGDPRERHIALHALGKRGDTQFVEAAEEFLRKESTLALAERREHGQIRVGFLRYLEELQSTITLPLARRWFHEPWPLSLAGEHILARHATPEDRPTLESAGVTALTSSNMYRLCSIVDAINTAGPDDSFRFLSEVYEHTPYSYARRRVVSALCRSTLSEAVRSYLTESLWDCEDESRELACGAIRKANQFELARIKQIANDPYEVSSVRQAAQDVLETGDSLST